MNRNGGNQSIAKIVKQVLASNEEKKFALFSFGATVDSTMQVLDLTNISNGTTVSTRVGAQIRLKKLHVKWNAIVGDSTNLLRVTVIYWKPNNAVDVPQASEVYQTTGVLAPLLKLNPNRFKAISDFLIPMDTYSPHKKGEFDLDTNELVSYAPGLDTGMNHLYLCVQSDSGGVPNPTFNFVGSVDYTDA